MNITITTESANPLRKTIRINDGKNTLTVITDKTSLTHTTSLSSSSDSIYQVVSLLKILEAVG